MINRFSKQPLYDQLYRLLRGKIQDGMWQPDDMLPTETELMKQYELSRATVRQALDLLVNDGLIYRQRGRGTFVARPTIEQILGRIISFTEDMQSRGFKPHTTILNRALLAAPEEIAEALQAAPGTELAHIERLRLADDEPMSIESSFLIHRMCPGVIERYDGSGSLRHLLEQSYGIRLVHARQKIRAVAAARPLADQLGIDRGAPLLYIERVSFSDTGAAVELLRTFHRGDRYTLYHELRD